MDTSRVYGNAGDVYYRQIFSAGPHRRRLTINDSQEEEYVCFIAVAYTFGQKIFSEQVPRNSRLHRWNHQKSLEFLQFFNKNNLGLTKQSQSRKNIVKFLPISPHRPYITLSLCSRRTSPPRGERETKVNDGNVIGAKILSFLCAPCFLSVLAAMPLIKKDCNCAGKLVILSFRRRRRRRIIFRDCASSPFPSLAVREREKKVPHKNYPW